MNDSGAKQQIVDKIKGSSNILVAVSNNPSVDDLSAALGLTVLLNKMKKHATAVFSGEIPPAITFLDPEKTFEGTVDSLRDFIIALDKEKADHLRYKVDGDVVKIFITPYRTTITGDDLEFSQGDYNVEMVLALGVSDQDHLDNALISHGRILHDATVATLSYGENKSDLGTISWHESKAGSLSEMAAVLAEALKSDKRLIDEQVATALLTGIVAATDRFSNNRTSSKVMTIAANLMAAGANQQLIASKLQTVEKYTENTGQNNDGSTDLQEGASTKVEKTTPEPVKEKEEDDGTLSISHEKIGDLDEVARQTAAERQAEAAQRAEDVLQQQLRATTPVLPTPVLPDLANDLAAEASQTVKREPEPEQTTDEQPASGADMPVWKDQGPAMGGTLNATAEQAAEDKRREEQADRNRTILSHDHSYVGDSQPSTYQSPLNASMQNNEPSGSNPFGQSVDPDLTLAEIDAQHRTPSSAHDDARAAVHAAYEAAPVSTQGRTLQPLSQPDTAPFAAAPSTPFEPAAASSPFDPPQMPGLPPMPDFSTLPPMPQNPTPMAFDEPLGNTLPPAPQNAPQTPQNDPGQFRIPGQGNGF